MKNIDCDKKYFDTRRKKVLNKNARHNVCFAYKDQEPDIENKKGTIINIYSLEQLKTVIGNLHLYLGEKARKLRGVLHVKEIKSVKQEEAFPANKPRYSYWSE